MENKLKKYEGEVFYTNTGLPFTFRFIGENTFKVIRNGKEINRMININQLNASVKMRPSKQLDLAPYIQGEAYIYALINDNRLKQKNSDISQGE